MIIKTIETSFVNFKPASRKLVMILMKLQTRRVRGHADVNSILS